LQTTLNDIFHILGDRRIAVNRELTKVYEEVYRGRISQAIEYFTDIKGEFTLVIEGKGKKKENTLTSDIEEQLQKMRLSGLSAKEAISRVTAETGLSKRELYNAWLKQV
jgi:16S rRNA (cytidine1402-2'-O)-methyltransferase